jgi:hypothetical protein
MNCQQILITDQKISKEQLENLCKMWFEDMVKVVVVDVETEKVAIGGELHADAEALLIEDGSKSKNIWGANLYPWHPPYDRIECTALINIRPNYDNPSMEILDEGIKAKVEHIVEKICF